MSTDLSDAIERAVPRASSGPALPTADDRLALGHRGVRRRRMAGTALLLTAAAAAAVVPAALTGGHSPDDRRAPQVADTVRPAPVPPVRPVPAGPEVPDHSIDWDEMAGDFVRAPIALVHLDWNGNRPVTFPGEVSVVEELRNPFVRSGTFGWAGTVRYRGTTYWALVHQSGNGSYGTDTRPIPGRTIEQWVRDHEEVDTSSLRPWVDLGPDGALTPRSGVTVVDQWSPARPDQADPAAPSATALLDVDGARLCLVARADGGRTEHLALPESEHKGCGDLPGWDYPGNPAS